MPTWADYAATLVDLPEPGTRAREVVDAARAAPALSLDRDRGDGPATRCCPARLIAADMLHDLTAAPPSVRAILASRFPHIPPAGEAWLCAGCLATLHREGLVPPGALPGTA